MKFKLIVAAVVGSGFLIGWLAMSAYFGSGVGHQVVAKYTGYSKVCVDGVQYIQFTSGAAVQVDTVGKPVPCK